MKSWALEQGANSDGHRFHHPEAIEINAAENYESLLKDAFVIADFKTRRALIIEQVEDLATEQGAEAVMPEALVDEVTSIVEWPQALVANFEKDFLEVPPEVLIAAMQSHQKCFALQNRRANYYPILLPWLILSVLIQAR